MRAAAGRNCRTLTGRALDEAAPPSRAPAAWLRVPIATGGQEAGVVVARPGRRRPFELGDGESLRLLAAQAALALRQDEMAEQNADLYRRERRRAEQLQAAADLTRRIVRVGRLGDVLEFAAAALKSAFGYDRVSIYLRETGRGPFALRASAGADGQLPAELDPAAALPAAWAVRSGEPQLVRTAAPADGWPMAELAVPIAVEGRPVGVLAIGSRADGLDSGDLALAESIADDLALAIENLRLARRVRSQAAAAERARVARELHDDTAQQLVAIGRQLELLRAKPGRAERLDALQTMVDEALANVRRISRNLRPTLLDELGLVAALEALIADHARQGGPPIGFRVQGRVRPLAPATELALYRVAQEAIANALKHADAKRLDVRLRFANPIVLEVADDGKGLAGDGAVAELARGGGMGLVGIRERAAEVGGRVEIASRPGKGTLVRAIVPLA